MTAGDNMLVVVAIKTDQPDIRRRLLAILAAITPVHNPPDTEAQVAARPVDQLTANDFDALAYWFTPEGARRLNVGDVVVEHPGPDGQGAGGPRPSRPSTLAEDLRDAPHLRGLA